MEERISLFVFHPGQRFFNYRKHVTVRDEHIEMAVVVVVEEPSAEAEVVASCHVQASRLGHVFKRTPSIVAPQVIGTALPVRYVQVEPAIVVVVAKRDAHPSHDLAVACDCHAADECSLLEGAVVLVVKEVCEDAVVGDENVRPTVIIVVRRANGEVLAVRL